ncbi:MULTISPECIES: L-rhamnose mutarotase [unclassified Alteromonas]|uniref:L-rhamnose mutarotase n=1 Tax=unclassified Alteromonas TaxID=2614992 RepID=UPI0005096705|nr:MULTISPECIES: L-rhamnose mutarotase [unclassified Alteromonas]
MEKIAFVMTLKPGFQKEYEKRHDEIWPELAVQLKEAGVSDYSIFYEERSNKLFAVLKRDDNHSMDDLPVKPIVKKWWNYMADIMDTHEDNSPVTTDLKRVFHLD